MTAADTSARRRGRRWALGAGLAVAAVVLLVVVRARGGAAYELKFATAFSDREGFAVIAGAVLAAVLVAGPRWGAALLASFAVLVLALGVMHPCVIAFQDTPRFDGCSVSATASALGLYAPASAVAYAAARSLASRVALTATTAATLLGAAAGVLLVALWLPWYLAKDDGRAYTQTGWQAFQRFDVYLVVVAAAAIVLCAGIALARGRARARLGPAVALLALTGAGLAFYRLFTAADAPSSGYVPRAGAFLALAALLTAAVGGLAAARQPRAGAGT